ncbi:hypothetical protein L0P88_19190 [Muricauda sp. SCSIO 64092]|uniref:hypothetical protein n=1 Tax=Allomuricauda sp. SCSIO 64092 TaxID=2908842 RepID=UPI001FF47A45|nr:hypothetical protein [Muricauda sp. SCSIO 64092]UOY06038.1 hypothetical protein L0P88_19190 [Muricauda sp. SCSIO 64092]
MFGILNQYYGLESNAQSDIESLILDKIGNKNNYENYWKNGVLKTISEKIKNDVEGITFGFIPNYGGQVYLSQDLGNGSFDITQIQFYVSLLHNIYTIQILEITETKEFHPTLKVILPKQHLKEIWVSPENHIYKSIFLKIQNTLEGILEKPIFLPHSIQQIELNNLKLPNPYNYPLNTIGNAFFKKIHPLHSDGCRVFGNENYKIEELI